MLTTEQKNGYTDGDQIGFFGSFSPVFARVVNNVLYAIYIEKDPGQSSSASYNVPVKKSRAWVNHVFQDDNIAAPYFAEYTAEDNTVEPGVTAADFPITMTVGATPKRPTGTAPAGPAPATPGPAPAPSPATPGPDTTPSPSPAEPAPAPSLASPLTSPTPTVVTPTPKQTIFSALSDRQTLLAIGGALLLLIVGVVLIYRRKRKR